MRRQVAVVALQVTSARTRSDGCRGTNSPRPCGQGATGGRNSFPAQCMASPFAASGVGVAGRF
jgi:hypothetical protein